MTSTNRDKPDLRVRKTRRAIIQALFSLLSKKSFETISVLDLVALAEIGPTTFYRHYQDKYDLAQAAIDDWLARLNPLLIHRLASQGLPKAIQHQPEVDRGLIAELALLRKINTPEVSFKASTLEQLAAQLQAELKARNVSLRYPGPIAHHFAAFIYSFLMVVADEGPDYDERLIENQFDEFKRVFNILNNPDCV
ncbi:MAG: TetR/AcrR family transcriptional regulator [Lactobacillus sp.]|uniref:TetR/AcrR family transcriptional regulator n=1 Tax=Lacticaseibacillus suilingensis TaxID=2799577 RepID=A0ABW4BGY8_9LACO|nr:TetR/AcrR family transcriptional regulator [Lacticaseibacillus suilingensis]MCI1894088.1 TetR/AcrR family transcriptional regulator [Lactobacillus sp.]MCI1917713.1 TetR/AcrR family transcriptional regulator [Lactobacillus sp.]MCI1941979.1 TetR/AcrR family transcriptional regulator [Lactobacillus sp.]MCI1972414.1 TetR/AcrR family transcriptional regulator [Lactobacillus sp.]MCI2017249.1 TetR/AcrR family transcriptional regulator [Lactobacillus sp.]